MPPAIPIAPVALAGLTTGAGVRMLDPLLPLIAAALRLRAAPAGLRMLVPLLPLIAADLGVRVAQATLLVAAFVLPYGLVQLVAGPLGDRLGKVRIAVFAVLLFGLGLVASYFTARFGALVGLRA